MALTAFNVFKIIWMPTYENMLQRHYTVFWPGFRLELRGRSFSYDDSTNFRVVSKEEVVPHIFSHNACFDLLEYLKI